MRLIFILVVLTTSILFLFGLFSERTTAAIGEVTEDTNLPEDTQKEAIIDSFLSKSEIEINDNKDVKDQSPLSPEPRSLLREERVKPMHDESSPAFRVMGWYFKAGYSLQPKYEYWLVAGKPYVLRTKIAKNSASFIDTEYHWYQYKGNDYWEQLKHEHSKEITFEADHEETRYYQATAQVWPSIFNPLLYSRMTKVNFLPKPVEAKGLKLTSDSDYIYVDKELNYQSIFLEATPDPINATGEILYSVKNSQKSLATIDPHTGELFPNKNGQEGDIEVTATLTNEKPDNADKHYKNKITATKVIHVTHLLTGDTQVYQHTPANYQINGNFNEKDFKIDWYRIESSGRTSSIPNNSTNKYSIPSTEIDNDDNIEIFAKISERNYKPPVDEQGNPILGSDGKPIPQKIVETNHIRLNVVSSSPNIRSSYYIENSNTKERGEKLARVKVGDKLRHDITFADSSTGDSKSFAGQRGELIVFLSQNEKIDETGVINFNYDKIIKTKINNRPAVKVSGLIVPPLNGGTFTISTEIINKSEKEFVYKPKYSINTKKTKNYETKINTTYADFSEDKITFKPVKKIPFGEHLKLSQVLLSPIVNKDTPPYFVEIKDDRRIKDPRRITVRTEGNFYRETYSNKKIFAHMFLKLLKLKDVKESEEWEESGINLNENYTVINSDYNETIESIPWSKFKGLRLFIEDLNYNPGNYKTHLIWDFNNAP
ncbi:hypothetical protein [Companilactobacillus mishanensis]|uniref:hypothetical protein n=1 Tax=Companilactobacillus mishanensis TaxID=2486008 RepID=UPI000F7A1DB4|nr:hypothetical protein [Companilactobacillus mishanensis]